MLRESGHTVRIRREWFGNDVVYKESYRTCVLKRAKGRGAVDKSVRETSLRRKSLRDRLTASIVFSFCFLFKENCDLV